MADQVGYVKEDGSPVTSEDFLNALHGTTPMPEGGPHGLHTESLPKRTTRGFGRTQHERVREVTSR